MGNDLYLVLDEDQKGCALPALIESMQQAGAELLSQEDATRCPTLIVPGVFAAIWLGKDAGANERGIFAALRVPRTAEEIDLLIDFAEDVPCKVYNPLLKEYVTSDTIEKTVEAETKARRTLVALLGEVKRPTPPSS